MADLVVVYQVVKGADGKAMIGNSVEVPLAEAVEGIRDDRYKHPAFPRGMMPVEWGGGSTEEAAAEVESVDGSGE